MGVLGDHGRGHVATPLTGDGLRARVRDRPGCNGGVGGGDGSSGHGGSGGSRWMDDHLVSRRMDRINGDGSERTVEMEQRMEIGIGIELGLETRVGMEVVSTGDAGVPPGNDCHGDVGGCIDGYFDLVFLLVPSPLDVLLLS